LRSGLGRDLRWRPEDGPAGGPTDWAGAFFRAEMGKFALTAVLFAFGVKFFAARFPALIVTYAICLLAYGLVMARLAWGGTASGTDKSNTTAN